MPVTWLLIIWLTSLAIVTEAAAAAPVIDHPDW